MKFPAYPNLRQRIRRYPLAADQTFIEGAAVTLNADGEVEECSADPSSGDVLGFALHAAGELPLVNDVLVALALPDATFVMQGTADPVAGDEGDVYGIVKDSDGVWILDKTETSAVVVQIEKIYIFAGRNQYEVLVVPAARRLELHA